MAQISCFLRGKDTLVCGESRGREKLSRLVECNDDIRTHLATYHLSRESFREYELILARSGFYYLSQQQLDELWVCPMHRHRLGKFWRESKTTCQYPKHSGDKRKVKGRDTVGFQMAKEIMTLYRENVPVGSRTCIISNFAFLHGIEVIISWLQSNYYVAGNPLLLCAVFIGICSSCRKEHKIQIEGENNWIRQAPDNLENESSLEKTRYNRLPNSFKFVIYFLHIEVIFLRLSVLLSTHVLSSILLCVSKLS